MISKQTSLFYDKREAGLIEVLALGILLLVLLVLGSSLLFNRAAYQLAESADRLSQGAIERIAVEQAVKDSLLAKLEVSPLNSGLSLDANIDAWCATYNSSAQNITIVRNGAAPSIAGLSPAMFPAAVAPAISSPNLSVAGDTFQTKDVISRGAALNGSPLTFSFRKIVATNTAENRTYSVTAQLWSVPLSNWALIAYGLPGRGFVPAATPSNVASILGSPSFTSANGRAASLTTLRPSPAFSNGDVTAFDQLYKDPGVGNPEHLPAYYGTQKSLFWNEWEFIWSGGNWPLSTFASGNYQDRLLFYATQSSRISGASRATAATTDLSAFNPPAQTGVTTAGTTTTINLGTYPEDILYLVDGTGGCTINITGAADNSLGPLVLVLANQGATKSVVNFSGTNARTVLVYSRNCANSFAAGTNFTGGIYLDQASVASGTLSLNGLFAFYGIGAANPFPGLTLSLTPPTGGLLADLQAITPRALIVSTNSVLN